MSSYVSTISTSLMPQQSGEINQFDITSEKIRFIHLKQFHSPPLRLLQAMLKNQHDTTFPLELIKRAYVAVYDLAAQSQLKVAQAILSHPNCPVLDESLHYDMTHDRIREQKTEEEYLEAKRHYEKIFPEGLPEEFDALNDAQKETLSDGAAQLLFFLQKITAVYKSIHPEQLQVFENQAKAGTSKEIYSKKLMTPREKEAIACAKEAAIKHNNATVLVVYGAGHHFEDHCDEAGFSYEEHDCSLDYNSFSLERGFEENLRSLVCIPNDVGFGNTLGIRCETSWETTIPFTWTPDGWIGEIPKDIKRFKFVITSQDGTVTWEKIDWFSSHANDSTISYDGNRRLFLSDIPQKLIGVINFG